MTKAVKLFCKKVGLTNTATTTQFTQITLTDTQGTPISCNYLKFVVAPSGANISTANDTCFVSLSGLSYGDNTATATNVGTSGTGGVLVHYTNPISLELPGSLSVSSIGVSKYFASQNTDFCVMYGVLSEQNPARLAGKNAGV